MLLLVAAVVMLLWRRRRDIPTRRRGPLELFFDDTLLGSSFVFVMEAFVFGISKTFRTQLGGVRAAPRTCSICFSTLCMVWGRNISRPTVALLFAARIEPCTSYCCCCKNNSLRVSWLLSTIVRFSVILQTRPLNCLFNALGEMYQPFVPVFARSRVVAVGVQGEVDKGRCTR